MPGAGALRDRVRFDPRTTDAHGRLLGPWSTTAKPVSAAIVYLKGTEPVMQQRLNGVQPVVIKVHKSSLTAHVTTAYRAFDVRAGVAYNIRSISPAKEPGFLEVLAEAQGANG